MLRRLNTAFTSKSFLYIAQFLIAGFYSNSISGYRGTDFGGYYVISQSIRSNRGLYDFFFDHKGPLYYLFLRILGAPLGYSLTSAIILLFFTVMLWFSIINLIANKTLKSRSQKLIVTFASIAALVNIPSNGSIVIFESSFIFLFLYTSYYFLTTSNLRWLYASSFLVSILILIRIDALLIVPAYCIFLILTLQKKLHILIFLLTSLISFLTILFSCGLIMSFNLQDYIVTNIGFNFFYINQSSNLHSLFYKPETLAILISSGVLTTFILVYSCYRPKIDNRKFLIFAFSLGLGMFFSVNQDKNYELFILYPFLIFGIIALLAENSHLEIPRSWILIAFLPLILLFMQLSESNKCIVATFDSCSQDSQFSNIHRINEKNKL